ncbi:flagellar hook-length control protein FliK [Arthrobacter sp. YA7-1]|uniref:flagellar hook-length control protein FliK n=1 Tax=Arthrobacter sp. YA7-1 TaxID=2987701 RepID=UPI002227FBC0|nr:flagellar hook-length control protein FliK [Arthrobacter sp. YA7-1]UYY82198.1 flagellar hook-length control protein FliK [Arthrobacter sp. YA7-1]
MQLPPAVAASPRPAVPGSPLVPQLGASAGFESVMNSVLASDAKTSDGTAQQAPDGGAQGKPAADGTVPLARAAKPEGTKVPKDTVDAAGAVDAAGVVAGAVAAVAAGAVAGAAAAGGPAAGTAAPQAGSSGGAVPVKVGVVDGTAPARVVAGTLATAGLAVGVDTGSIQAALTANPAPSNAPGTSAQGPVVPPLLVPAPSVPAVLVGKPGQSSRQIPASPLPASLQPAGTPPTSPLPASPLPGTALPTKPLPAGPEPGVNATAAPAGESATAVALPAGKPATQQEPQRILGQDNPAAPALALPAGIPAGIPVVVQPASPLQEAPSAAPAGMAPLTPQADPAKLVPQVSGPLFSLASAAPGAHVMTLKLSPEDLGPLTVRAHIDGSGVRIELFAPGEAGREAVRSVLPELRRGLGESGFGASLDLSEHNAPADAGAGGSDPRDRRPADSPAFPRGSDGEPVRLPRTAVVPPRSSTSSLDILV